MLPLTLLFHRFPGFPTSVRHLDNNLMSFLSIFRLIWMGTQTLLILPSWLRESLLRVFYDEENVGSKSNFQNNRFDRKYR